MTFFLFISLLSLIARPFSSIFRFELKLSAPAQTEDQYNGEGGVKPTEVVNMESIFQVISALSSEMSVWTHSLCFCSSASTISTKNSMGKLVSSTNGTLTSNTPAS